MKRVNQLLKSATVVLAVALPAGVYAESGLSIPAPVKGKQCVEPTDQIRRNHMDYLMHQRDKTMREGIRTQKYSLKECINCHVPAKTAPQQATGDHFCMNCHQYTSVKIDCFECHATHPEADATTTLSPKMGNSTIAHRALSHSPEQAVSSNGN
ncbi:hypothetical protein D5085_02020 [Ectothiorhodospiraceae bacterium BW-2]|nr:hypothetical protein D5085_02020 [Ectothiorhodospiraceae bacterium BW-2]